MDNKLTKAKMGGSRIPSLWLAIICVVMSLPFTACEDDVPENIKEELVGAWKLHNESDIAGTYVFEANGSGYIYHYMNYTDFSWTYNSDTKTIKIVYPETTTVIGNWKIIKFSGDYMTLEDLDWRKEDGDTDDPFFRMDRIKDWSKPYSSGL